MEKYLDANFLKYPGNEAHLVIDGVGFVVEDTTMTAAKEGTLTLRNARTGRTSRLDFQTKDKLPFPIYEYSVRQGVSRLGSGSVDQGALFDGDPGTFWEPDANDPIKNWWIEIDLGRTVLVDEIVLKFADAGNGDPFRQFKVLTEPGQQLILEEAGELEFAVVAGTDAPNEDQRVFSFGMEDTRDAAPGWDGRMVEDPPHRRLRHQGVPPHQAGVRGRMAGSRSGGPRRHRPFRQGSGRVRGTGLP